VQQRQDLLIRYPEYGQLSKQAAELQGKIRDLPLVPEEANQIREQTQLFQELDTISSRQEQLLSNIALRREASTFVFPPLLTTKEIQQRMPEGQLMLAYLVGSRSFTAFAVDNERLASWQVQEPDKLPARIADFLGKIGVSDRKTPLDPANLHDDSWRQDSVTMLQQLSNVRNPALWNSYRELVIVPDGLLWYLPFESLYTAGDATGRPLISKVPLRYAPTASLSNSRGLPPPRQATTVVIPGRLLPGQDTAVTAQAAEEIRLSLPGTTPLTSSLPVPSSLLVAATDRLISLTALDQNPRAPYSLTPMVLDRGKRGADLESWLNLPWYGPKEVVLPGFHTAAETGFKQVEPGMDIFLPACALMASGTNSILLSRWPLGGQSTFDLVREYVQELPFTRASDAWRRSVLLGARNPIVAGLEPRLRSEGVEKEVRGTHPYFWASYMLIDNGVQPAGGQP
jgi:CHAT domain-containing protein